MTGDGESLMNHYVIGDKHAELVLECLSHIVTVYGQHVIVLQYLHHVRDLVCYIAFHYIVVLMSVCMVLLLVLSTLTLLQVWRLRGNIIRTAPCWVV